MYRHLFHGKIVEFILGAAKDHSLVQYTIGGFLSKRKLSEPGFEQD